jgi:hypothetical protein
VPKLRPVPVAVPKDLHTSMSSMRDAHRALRKELGGVPNTEKAALWGKAGTSKLAVDPFDGRVSKSDEAAMVKLAADPAVGPIQVLKRLAQQGSMDPGAGVLHRNDKLGSFLGGRIKSFAVLEGTATKAADGTKQAGNGAKLSVQVEYQATRGETKKIMDLMGKDAVRLDTDAAGKPQSIKARINLEANVTATGIRDIHFSASIDHVPALDAMKLLAQIGSEDIEFPAALPLKVLMQNNSTFSMQFQGQKGANIGLKANLSALNSLDDQQRLPDAMLSANLDGTMKKIDGKDFLDTGKLDVSLDSKLNVLWKDDGAIELQVQDGKGKYVKYDTANKLGMEVNEGMILMLLAAAGTSLDG